MSCGHRLHLFKNSNERYLHSSESGLDRVAAAAGLCVCTLRNVLLLYWKQLVCILYGSSCSGYFKFLQHFCVWGLLGKICIAYIRNTDFIRHENTEHIQHKDKKLKYSRIYRHICATHLFLWRNLNWIWQTCMNKHASGHWWTNLLCIITEQFAC